MITQSSEKKIFIAIGLPPEVTDNIGMVHKKLKASADKKQLEISWSPKENWHITLAFIGNTPLDKIELLKPLLESFAKTHGPFPITLRQLGGFPETDGARVLWLGVSASRSLLEFQRQLSQHLAPWGYQGGLEEFKPHLTLAKLRNHKNITDLISPWVRKGFGKVLVREIRLYESHPMGAFSRYVEIARYPLTHESTISPLESDSGNS